MLGYLISVLEEADLPNLKILVLIGMFPLVLLEGGNIDQLASVVVVEVLVRVVPQEWLIAGEWDDLILGQGSMSQRPVIDDVGGLLE